MKPDPSAARYSVRGKAPRTGGTLKNTRASHTGF